MKILITGGTGFLGSKLVRKLIEDGHSLTLILRETSDMRRLLPVQGLFDFFFSQSDDYDTYFQKADGFDVIIHCATNYGRAGVSLTKVLEDNLVWPIRLLELCIKYGCKLFINTDTFFAKKDTDYYYLREYILSKILLRKALVSYSSLINIANMRLEHVYGPEDSPDKFTPWIVTQLLSSINMLDMTSGVQKRDFIYLDDVVNAYICLLHNKGRIRGFREYEVGTGESYSIREFVELVKYELKSNTNLQWGVLPMRENEFMDSKANIANLKELGWAPTFSLQEGIKKLIDYYRN